MTKNLIPLWEVFIRPRNGLAHKHCGSVHAADAVLQRAFCELLGHDVAPEGGPTPQGPDYLSQTAFDIQFDAIAQRSPDRHN